MHRPLLLCLLVLLSSTPYARQGISGAIVTGTVVDDRHQPIPRAGVALLHASWAPVRSVTADDNGRFEMAGVPANTYTLIAWHRNYVPGALGQRRARPFGVPLPLRTGDRQTFTLRLVSGAVISGVVRNAEGLPVRSAIVRAVPIRTINGVRAPDPDHSSGAETNSRGEFRVFGLEAADYIVAGTAPGDWSPDIQSGTEGVERTRTVLPVFFPDTDDPTQADTISLRAGETRGDVELRLRSASTGRVAVRLVNSTGIEIEAVEVTVDAWERSRYWWSPYTPSVSIDRTNASFDLTGLPLGSHRLAVRARLRQSPYGVENGTLWATADVAIDERPSQLTLPLEQGASLKLRWTFSGTSSRPDRRDVLLSLVGDTAPTSEVWPVARDDSAATFKGAAPGRYRLRARLPRAWTLKSAMLGNRDLADSAFDLGTGDDVGELVVTFTDRGPVLTGVVADADGTPTFDAVVVVAPANRRDWRTGSRRLRADVPDATGRFTIRGLPAGDYVMAALRDDIQEADLTAALLDRVLTSPVRLSLIEGETIARDLRLRQNGSR